MLTLQEVIKAKNEVQKAACIAAAQKLKEDRKCILNKATGSGKTRTAYKMVFHKYLDNINTVLFMVPKQSLVTQTIREWLEPAEQEGYEFNYTTVYNLGDCKTIEKLEEFVRQPGINIVFAVYNSVGIKTDGSTSIVTSSGIEFDLAIYDECHRAAGKEFGLFTSCVTDEIVKARYKLFMTATMKSYDMPEDSDEEIPEFDMTNIETYGEVAYSLSVAEAIRLGLLVPFDTYFLEVSDTRLKSMLKKEVRYLGELVNGRQLAAAYAVLNAYRMGSRKILTMYHRRQDAHDFNNLFRFMQREYNFLPGAIINCVSTDVTPAQLDAPMYISANDSLAARQWWLKDGPFTNSDTALATSSPWIKEGEDVPCIDTIVFGDRFSSGIDIIQIIGRALRWYPTKDCARIILPVMEGEANKVARNIRATVSQLATNVDEVQVVRREYMSPSENDTLSTEEDINEGSDEGEGNARPPRWEFASDQTTVTDIEINQSEFTMSVVHDNTFSDVNRIEHDEMLEKVSLQLQGGWQQFLRGQQAKRFVKNMIAMINDPNATHRGSLRMYNSDQWYYERYAKEQSLDIEIAIEELEPHMKELRDLRDESTTATLNFLGL